MIDKFINNNSLDTLKNKKNLLGFSGGVDSSALFFILFDLNINFDIAIIDYAKRKQSKMEVEYAKELSTQYNKKCHILTNIHNIESNFEANARKIRYTFFNSLIVSYDYDNLILAHHLDDKIEWFFMQFASGAGLNTILGFNEIEVREIKNKQYKIIRPLINVTKNEIVDFNKDNNIKYFIDESNFESNYTRNFFRNNITLKLSAYFANGIRNSFKYLTDQKDILYPNIIFCKDRNLYYFKSCFNEIFYIDKLSKQFNYVLSAKQKDSIKNILKANKDCVMGEKIVIAKQNKLVFVGIYAKYLLSMPTHDDAIEIPKIKIESLKIPKQQKDRYRIEKIPKKIRTILYLNSLDIWHT